MTTHNGIQLVNESREFEIGELFFSTTDKHGVIRHGNDLFARIASYELAELTGRPHSVVRHPDMPRAIFKLFWDTIASGKSIAAYVKNLARDGRYYWVMAVAMPCEDGYLSVRLKPTSPLFPQAIKLYESLRSLELSIEVEPKQRVAAIAAASAELGRQLLTLGFESYDAFMLDALTKEIDSRQAILDDSGTDSKTCSPSLPPAMQAMHQRCQTIDRGLRQIYGRLAEFRAVQLQLTTQSRSILQSADTIRSLSINATISAHRLGSRAATLNLVAESLGAVANDNQQIIRSLSTQMDAVATTLSQLMFDVAATKLQSEVCLQFLEEIFTNQQNADEHIEVSLRTLFRQMFTRVNQMFESLRCTAGRLVELRKELDSLNRNNQKLYFVQFTGHKEATGIDEANGFAVVFDEVREHTGTTREDCKSLTNAVYGVMHELRALGAMEDDLLAQLVPLTEFRSLRTLDHPDLSVWQSQGTPAQAGMELAAF